MLFSRKPSGAVDDEIITLPSSALLEIFGKVSYRRLPGELEVLFTILLPTTTEKWKTGVALDASESMSAAYGSVLTGSIPPKAVAGYRKKGWIRSELRDGETQERFKKEAYDDAIALGYLQWTANEVEPEARKFLGYLAANVDMEATTRLVYWACEDGAQIELVGDIAAADCATLAVPGPQKLDFGKGTMLTPVLRHFDQEFSSAPNGLYVFMTDGRLEDLAAVKAHTTALARKIEAGQRNPIKCILIGMGPEVDEGQMTELDDLDTGTDVDIWDHKIARDMRDVTEIFAELVDETQIVAPMATIYDDAGNVAHKCSDGLPARVVFRMPDTSKSFTLEVPGLPGDGRFVQAL